MTVDALGLTILENPERPEWVRLLSKVNDRPIGSVHEVVRWGRFQNAAAAYLRNKHDDGPDVILWPGEWEPADPPVQPAACSSCGTTSPTANLWCSNGFHAPPVQPEPAKLPTVAIDLDALSGFLDGCLDGLGHTDVHSIEWLREFVDTNPAPVRAEEGRDEPAADAWKVGDRFTIKPEYVDDGDDGLTPGRVYEVATIDDDGLRIGFLDDDGDEIGTGVQYVDRAEPVPSPVDPQPKPILLESARKLVKSYHVPDGVPPVGTGDYRSVVRKLAAALSNAIDIVDFMNKYASAPVDPPVETVSDEALAKAALEAYRAAMPQVLITRWEHRHDASKQQWLAVAAAVRSALGADQ